MNDIDKVEGRLFKYYSVVADGSALTPDQIKHFLELRPYPTFRKETTIEQFHKILFGHEAQLTYVFEEFFDVPGQNRLRAYQFSPVYAGRIALTETHWKKKLKAEKVLGVKNLERVAEKHSNQTLSAAEKHKREIKDFYARGYLAGQTRGVLTSAREAIDYMREFSKINSSVKYGPGLIDDVEEWLLDAEAGPSDTPVDIETLILHMVGKFTERTAAAARLKNAGSDISIH
ncbi:hypothetical protein D3C81_1367470 [compost metagenome]